MKNWRHLALGIVILVLTTSILSTGQTTPNVTLNWNTDTNTGTTAINIYRGTVLGTYTKYTQLSGWSTEPTNYTDTTPMLGWNHYVITYIVGGKESGPSNDAAAQVPVPPTNLTAK